MSHTSKKCRKIWQFIGIFMLTCVVSVLPASLAGAQRATKSTVAQMEKEVGRLELDIPIETSRVGWTYVPILNIYPSNTTGLNTSEPISYANCLNANKAKAYYESAVTWTSSNSKVIDLEYYATGCVRMVAKSEGTATITARLGKHSVSQTFVIAGKSTIKFLKVQMWPLNSEGESKPGNTLTVTQGEEFQVPARYWYQYITDGKVSSTFEVLSSNIEYGNKLRWKSANNSIVDVKYVHFGGFKALKPGKTVLTVSIGGYTDTLTVTVKPNPRKKWVEPVQSDEEKTNYVSKYGKEIHSKKELYKYVFDHLKVGNYEFGVIYPRTLLDFNLIDELDKAINMYDEYVIDNPNCTKYDEPLGSGAAVYLQDGREGYHYRMYQPKSRQYVQKMTRKADSVLKGILKKNKSTKKRLRAIHDYIIKRCDYDRMVYKSFRYKGKRYVNKKKPSELSFTAYGALIRKKAVCEGYAKAFTLLARRAGIPCVYVTGTTYGIAHAWNLVKVGGKYRYIDTTWDDPVLMRKFNPRKPFAVIKNKKGNTKYFLVSKKKLSKDHKFSYSYHVKTYKNYLPYHFKK